MKKHKERQEGSGNTLGDEAVMALGDGAVMALGDGAVRVVRDGAVWAVAVYSMGGSDRRRSGTAV